MGSAGDPYGGTPVHLPAIVRVFGGMGVRVDGEPISIGGVRQRRLLALLVVRAGQVVSVDWLAEHLWTDEERPAAPVPTVRTYVSRLRGALPEAVRDWITTAPSGYRLTAPDEAVEHLRFQLLRAEAAQATRDDDPQTALRALDDALALWTGDPFRELEDIAAVRAEVEQLHVDRLEMLEERWQATLALGRHTQITGELAAFTAEHGLRDRAVRQHALALHRSGRTPDALAAIAEHRRLLAEETGLDPSPAVLELEQQLFAGDPALDATAVGRPLRGYRLLEESGRGAFSVVWRGLQPSVDREVAIKQIHAELASQPDFIRRFEAEAHLVARIEHPHIVPLIDFWRDPDSAYLVMRWMSGGTLERRLDGGQLSVEQTLTLASQIGLALSAAHARGVVHRDVKPPNILFDDNDNAFLGDFGIAMATDGAGGAAAELSLGTPAYAAPEQIRREPLGPQADVFSLGVVLFECLTGQLPLGELPGPETVRRQQVTPFPTLVALRSDVPAHVSDAVARATAKDPADRHETVLEFVAELGAAPSLATAMAPAPAPVLPDDLPNPYVGLRPFDEADVDRFFGRERLVEELADRLRGDGLPSRCVVVIGPSGSGKSSVVRAGLVPAVQGGAVPGSQDWFTTTMVPGVAPFDALASALGRIAITPLVATSEDLARAGHRGVLRTVRACLSSDTDHVLLVVDQFEELFTTTPPDVADAFLGALATAVGDPQSPLRVVATVRADHFHRPLAHPAFATLAKRCSVAVTPLAGDELERAITQPAHAHGVRFEPGLVARIAADAAGRPGTLPLLQYSLAELFERRDGARLTMDAYDDIGGLVGALADRAEKLYDEADDDERAATRRLFGRLTDPGEETTDLRRRARLADLGDDDAATAVLERYAAARLLTFDHETVSREPTVEVAHEALLREWPRLVDWLDEDREVLRAAAAIAAAADVWHSDDRSPTDLYRGGRLEEATALAAAAPNRLRPLDLAFVEASRETAADARDREIRRVARLRRLVAGIATALVIALVAGGVAVIQQRQARTAATLAELATLISRSAALVGEDDDAALLLALEANRRAPGAETEAAVLDALSNTSVGARVAEWPLPSPAGSECQGNNVAGPRDQTLTSVVDGELVRLDLATGQVASFGASPAPCVVWGADAADSRWWAFDDPSRRFWTAPFGEVWGEPATLPLSTFPVGSPLVGDDRIAALEFREGGRGFHFLDLDTAMPVGPAAEPGFPLDLSIHDEGTALVGSYERSGDPDGGGLLTAIDARTGTERWRYRSSVPAVAIDLHESAGHVLGALFGGELVTVDVESGEELHRIDTGVEEAQYVRGLDGGRVVLVAEGRIVEVDRTTGPTGRGFDVDDGGSVLVDADGVVHTRGLETVRTYDLDVPALATSTIDLPPGVARLGYGRAVVWRSDGLEGAVVIDLETGDRTSEELLLPDGTNLGPADVFPAEDGGIWSFTAEPTQLRRWVDGDVVETIELQTEGFTDTHQVAWDEERFVTHAATGRGVDEPVEVVVASTAADDPGVRFRIVSEDDVFDAVTPDFGVHLLGLDSGTLRTHGPDGQLVDTWETGLEAVIAGAVEPASGLFAVTTAVGESLVAVIDQAAREVTPLSITSRVTGLSWIDGTDTLLLDLPDGRLQLWDVAADRPRGQLLRSEGGAPRSTLYEPHTRTLWAAAEGTLSRLPLDPAVWVSRACEVVGRDLTQSEWDRLVPGGGEVISACNARGPASSATSRGSVDYLGLIRPHEP